MISYDSRVTVQRRETGLRSVTTRADGVGREFDRAEQGFDA